MKPPETTNTQTRFGGLVRRGFWYGQRDNQAMTNISPKTNFSFEIFYAQASKGKHAGDGVMPNLGPELQGLLAAKDSAARVIVSDSHKGSNNRIVEITTTLQDAELAEVLKAFSESHGLTVSALE